MDTIHTFSINGVRLATGDLICTTDGGPRPLLPGLLWRLVGLLIPGEVDHIAIYVGPGGRCVEAGGRFRIRKFSAPETWDGGRMYKERGFVDSFIGAAYPLAGRSVTKAREKEIRLSVADYCVRQAEAGKYYNFNFFDSKTEKRFYCSQLAYTSYLKNGIDLNTGRRFLGIPGTESIIFPQEIWDACANERAGDVLAGC